MMGRNIKIGRRRATLEMTSGLQDIVDRVLSSGKNKLITDRLQREADELLADAYKGWPRQRPTRKYRNKPGGTSNPTRSADALQSGLRFIPPATIESFVQIDPASKAAEYAKYIRSKQIPGKVSIDKNGLPKGPHAFAVLLQRPARKRAKLLTKDLGELLAAIAAGGR